MSYGLVICSACCHEVHQREDGWRHCGTGSRLCHNGKTTFPESRNQIKGAWCGMDDLDRTMGLPPKLDQSGKVVCAHSPAIVHRSGGKNAKLDNVCGNCGERIIRKVPAGAWKLSATQEPGESAGSLSDREGK